MESVMQLDDWYRFADERPGCVSGSVSNNPHFEDGSDITTSRIVAFDAENQIICTFSGSLYKIMEPRKDYEAAYPNAKERFFKTLQANVPSFSVNSAD